MPDIHVSTASSRCPTVPEDRPLDRLRPAPRLLHQPPLPWLRHAGRLIIWSILFIIGLVIAYVWTKKPKPAEPATWAQTILGAMFVWLMMALGYGTIPHECHDLRQLVPQLQHGDLHAAQEHVPARSTSPATSCRHRRVAHLRHRAHAAGLVVRALAEAAGVRARVGSESPATTESAARRSALSPAPAPREAHLRVRPTRHDGG